MRLAKCMLTSVVAAFAAAATFGAGSALAQTDTVKVGVIYPLSGPVAQAGKDSLAAVEAAVDVVNNKHDFNMPLARSEGLPNLGGAKIELVVGDHQGKPELGRAEAERMITQENVVALIGAYHSSVTAAVSNVAERRQVPFVNGESSSPKLTERGLEWFFRTGPHDGHYTEVMFDFIEALKAERGIEVETAGILYEDTEFGTSSARTQRALAKEHNIEVVVDLPYRSKTTSLTSEVQRLKAAQPDVFFPTSYTSDAMLLMSTMKRLNYKPDLIIAQDAGFNDPTFIETMGEDAEGIISRAPFALDMADQIPLIDDLNQLYKKHSGGRALYDPPIRSFTGALVLFDAINRAGSTDPEEIRQALVETDVPASQLALPWEGVAFGPDGQNKKVSAVLTQIQDGRYWSIYPFEAAAKELIYPFPDWDER